MTVIGSGSCICGDVKYTLTEKPAMQILCHCLKCRKFSSSTNTAFIFVPRSSLHIVLADAPSSCHPMNPPTVAKAAPRISDFTVHHESGMDMTFHWCARCGTKIYKEAHTEEHKDIVLVAAGTLDSHTAESQGVNGNTNEFERAGFGIEDMKLDAEFYVKDRVQWVPAQPGVNQCQRFD